MRGAYVSPTASLPPSQPSGRHRDGGNVNPSPGMPANAFSLTVDQHFPTPVQGLSQAATQVSPSIPPAYLRDRYWQEERSYNNNVAYVVFGGHDVGVFYNWFRAEKATTNHPKKGWKAYTSQEEACVAWYQWVYHNILPKYLSYRHHSNPFERPTHDDLSIAGRHRPANLMPTTGPLLLSQQLNHASFHSSASLNHDGPSSFSNPPPAALSSSTMTAPAASSVNLNPAANPPPAYSISHQGNLINTDYPIYIVIMGRSPGVYANQAEAEAAMGPLGSPTYEGFFGSYAEACVEFVAQYKTFKVTVLS
ncbi:hypothetical protein BDN70DRAFT_899670 [Pholiota conissans]|uniref:Ribonuclease H1 N-terminal domain-containing protein n=1 Tax=Pholiota conissans TaxID=109636 RepID=A0A9P5YPJ1_9AGAR|nr:hypothetical protein BDN70DRAFT_899670 [Pholiota conissans]